MRCTPKWEDEKAQLQESKDAKVRLEKARLDLEQAQNEARYEEAAKLQYGIIPQLEEQIRKEAELQKEDALIQETVNEETIARIVSKVDRYRSDPAGGERTAEAVGICRMRWPSGSSGRTRHWSSSVMPSCAAKHRSRMRTARSAASCS